MAVKRLLWRKTASVTISNVNLIERPGGKNAQKNIAEPAFSSDGRYVYFSQDTTSGRVWQYNKDSTGSVFSIKRLDRETGEIDVVVSGPGGAAEKLGLKEATLRYRMKKHGIKRPW